MKKNGLLTGRLEKAYNLVCNDVIKLQECACYTAWYLEVGKGPFSGQGGQG